MYIWLVISINKISQFVPQKKKVRTLNPTSSLLSCTKQSLVVVWFSRWSAATFIIVRKRQLLTGTETTKANVHEYKIRQRKRPWDFKLVRLSHVLRNQCPINSHQSKMSLYNNTCFSCYMFPLSTNQHLGARVYLYMCEQQKKKRRICTCRDKQLNKISQNTYFAKEEE
jgi:hypothetical protein